MMTRHSTEKTLPREGVSPAPAAEGPRVSVIVPAHDAEATLGDTLASLRAQTLADLEAIVVDDASADGTRALAAEPPRPRTPASGSSPCRPTSAPPAPATPACARPAAAGSCSSTPTTGSSPTTSPPWSRPPRPTRAPTARSAATATRPTDGRLGGVHPPRLEGDLFRTAARRCPFAVHACLVRREAALALGGFDPDLGPVEDWDFWQRLGRAGGRLVPAGTAGAVYRLRPGSAMRRPSPRYLERGLEVLRRGHAPDPRVPAPHPDHAAGRPPEELPAARARFLLYLLGNRLGLGTGAGEVLDRFEGPALAGLAPDEAAGGIAHGLLAGAGCLSEDVPALWARRGAGIAAALDRLGAAAGEPDLGGALRLALARRLADALGPTRLPATVGGVRAVRLDRRRRCADLPVPPGTRVLRVRLDGGEADRRRAVELPVEPGAAAVPAAALARAVLAAEGPELARRACWRGAGASGARSGACCGWRCGRAAGASSAI